MHEIVFALAVLLAFGIVGRIDADTTEAMLAEHAPVVIASNHLEE